jgi:hypothetical protein
MPKLVYIESPFAGEVGLNIEYARACMADSLSRGEFPFASHLLYTQKGILDDDIPEERKKGMEAGFAFAEKCDLSAVYTDLGISGGMQEGVERAREFGREVVYRGLPREQARYFMQKKIDLTIKREIPPWWKFWKWQMFSPVPYLRIRRKK